jgi:hypothetical protein
MKTIKLSLLLALTSNASNAMLISATKIALNLPKAYTLMARTISTTRSSNPAHSQSANEKQPSHDLTEAQHDLLLSVLNNNCLGQYQLEETPADKTVTKNRKKKTSEQEILENLAFLKSELRRIEKSTNKKLKFIKFLVSN